MTLEQILQKEIEDYKTCYDREKEESPYKRYVKQRIDLIDWVLESAEKPNIRICELLESKMQEVILKINQTYDVIEADKLHTELRILDWIFYQVCSNEIKKT